MLEFVEILNPGLAAEDLSNWKLTGAVDYTFPTNTLLPADQVLVVLPFDPNLPANAVTLSAFRAQYGVPTNATLLGAYSGALSDTGDTLRLERPDNPPSDEPTYLPMLLEDEVAYGAAFPWPTAAAGGGPALQRRSPDAWGNDPQSWMVGTLQLATPGTPPLADLDGDGLPDAYEIETYGSINVAGSSPTGDTDGDGACDVAEYIAGTAANNANSRFKINASLLPGGSMVISFPTEPITGLGFFGLERRYSLEQTTNIGIPESWSAVPGYANLPATGGIVSYTNSLTNAVWSARGRVWLQ